MKTLFILKVSVLMPIVTVGWQPFLYGTFIYVVTALVLFAWRDLWQQYIADASQMNE